MADILKTQPINDDYNVDDLTEIAYRHDGVQLAFVGDSVFDLYVRTRLLKEKPQVKTEGLHKIKSHIVSANFQALVMAKIKDGLSEDEEVVFKRARNISGKAAPKSTTASKYRNSTGFEALLGALFLAGKDERLQEIMNFAYELKFEGKDGEKR